MIQDTQNATRQRKTDQVFPQNEPLVADQHSQLLEEIVIEYVEKFGLTESARNWFIGR